MWAAQNLKDKIMVCRIITSLLLGSALMGHTAMALTATQSVQREVIVQHADGTETLKLESADIVTPGEKIVYSLHYHNDQVEAANNIVLVMPVPSEVTYQEGSAESSGVRTAYSTDGGKTYMRRDGLTVQLEDGTMGTASAGDITHIRWHVGEAIAPDAGGVLSFKGQLK